MTFRNRDCVVLDLVSGTYFSASEAVVIDWASLDEEQLDVMINGSDSERSQLGEAIGTDLSL